MKLLKELSIKEANDLFNNNKKFRELCEEYARESAYFWNEEILQPLLKCSGVNYGIDAYSYSYIKISSIDYYHDFLKACKDIAKSYCIFSDETTAKIKRAIDKTYTLQDATYGYIEISDAKYSNLETWMNDIIETAKSELIEAITKNQEYGYSDDGARDQIEILIDNNDFYMTDGVKLYETVVRCYD